MMRRVFSLSFLCLLSACYVADGAGYGYNGGYYEPATVGVDYVGWGPDYRVAPYRRGYVDHHDVRAGDHHYRAAPAGHAVPSIAGHGPAGGHGGGHGGSGHH